MKITQRKGVFKMTNTTTTPLCPNSPQHDYISIGYVQINENTISVTYQCVYCGYEFEEDEDEKEEYKNINNYTGFT